MKISGIYQIQSRRKSERTYIGSAENIGHRWSTHLAMLRKCKHHSVKLQNHYNKYGERDLQLSVLIGCEKEDLLKHEQFFIDSYNPWFNICKTAGSPLGRKHSDETKQKQRELALKRGKMSEESKRKMSEHSATKGKVPWNKGKKTPKEVTEKWHHSRRLNPYIPSEETKQKLREASLRNGNIPPSHTGIKRSEETKIKLSKSLMGNKCALGYKHTEEERKKRSERVILFYANKRLLNNSLN